MDPHDINWQLEQAALSFFRRNAYGAAACCLIHLLGRQPQQARYWHGLASALAGTSEKRPELAVHAARCANRAIELQPDHAGARQLLDALRQHHPTLPHEAHPGGPLALLDVVGESSQMYVEAVRSLTDWNERMGLVMFLGDQNVSEMAGLLAWALANDPHPDVRMAAAKRLGPWGGHDDVRKAFEKLAASGDWEELEPYFSGALKSIAHPWAKTLYASLPEDKRA